MRPGRRTVRDHRFRITRPLAVRNLKRIKQGTPFGGYFDRHKSQLTRLRDRLRATEAPNLNIPSTLRTSLPQELDLALARILGRNRSQMIKIPSKRRRSIPTHRGAAAFDADGTLWAGDVGEGFFEYLLDRGYYDAVPDIRARWARYQRKDFDRHFTSESFYELMVTGLAGHRIRTIRKEADNYFQLHAHRIFRPMVALIQTLQTAGVDIHVVSGSPLWVVEAGARYFNIPARQVIGLEPRVSAAGIIEERIKEVYVDKERVRVNPWKANKPKLLQRRLGSKELVLVAGDSHGDLEMLKMAKRHARVLVNPKGEALTFARKRGAIVIRYEPEHEATGGLGRIPDWSAIPDAQPIPPKDNF